MHDDALLSQVPYGIERFPIAVIVLPVQLRVVEVQLDVDLVHQISDARVGHQRIQKAPFHGGSEGMPTYNIIHDSIYLLYYHADRAVILNKAI